MFAGPRLSRFLVKAGELGERGGGRRRARQRGYADVLRLLPASWPCRILPRRRISCVCVAQTFSLWAWSCLFYSFEYL